jgi:hypothetical protein
MAMIDNPDHPWADGPPEPPDPVKMPEGLWSAALRVLDPQPVSTMVSSVQFQLMHGMEELNKLSYLRVDGAPLWSRQSFQALQGAMLDANKATKPPAPTGIAEVSRALVTALVDELSEALDGCDHSVGICMCDDIGVLAELKLALDGKLTCPQCGGDTYIFDEAVYAEKFAGLDSDEQRYGDSESLGYVTCPTCTGAGVVRTEDAK